MNNFIELANLTKTFIANKNVKVLKRINFKFNLGKIYSLTGPSGSGKSTLLNLISLIDRPSSGSIKFQGNQINFNNNTLNGKTKNLLINFYTLSKNKAKKRPTKNVICGSFIKFNFNIS